MGLFIAAARAAEDVEGAAEHGGGEAASGLPQLDFATWPSQIFWLLVTLVVLYLLFSRVVLPRIGGLIEERFDAVEDDLDRAADYKRRAEEAEKAYQRALAEARAEAHRIAEETRAAMQREVEAAMARADAEIAARAAEGEQRIREIRDAAAEAVAEVAADTAREVIAAVAPGVAADEAAVRAAVAERLEG